MISNPSGLWREVASFARKRLGPNPNGADHPLTNFRAEAVLDLLAYVRNYPFEEAEGSVLNRTIRLGMPVSQRIA